MTSAIEGGIGTMFQIPPEIDVFIQRDQRAVRVYLTFGVFVILLGLAMVVLSFLLGSSVGEGVEGLISKLGGGFIATLSAFPLREYLARCDRISALRALQARWKALSALENPPADEFTHARRLIFKLYDKAVLG